MFDANNGFFHLVFANEDDRFYTDSYIRMDLESYIRAQLIQDGFKQLCFIGKAPYHSHKEYRMVLFGGLSKKQLLSVSKAVKHGGFSGFFSGKKKKSEEEDADVSPKAETIDFSSEELADYMMMLAALMSDKKKSIAAVCPIGIFSDCCLYDGAVGAMTALRRNHSERSIFILTGSVDAKKNNPYFRKSEAEHKSIFFNENLFPEICETFDESRNCLPKLIFTYDLLAEAFGSRMLVLNQLSFESMCRAVRYLLMRSGALYYRNDPDIYAAMIWAWYENSGFRAEYASLNLPENPFRSTKVIVESLSQPFFTEADRIVGDDPDAQKILDDWFAGYDRPVAIVYRRMEDNDCFSNILTQLCDYRSRIEGHENLLDFRKMQQLEEMTEYFSRPSYPSANNQGALPHEGFGGVSCRKTIGKLYSSLKNREWNNWDSGAMYLLFLLFDLCYRHTTEVVDKFRKVPIDYFNDLGKKEFNMCMRAIGHCIAQSEENPHNARAASAFISDAEFTLRGGDKYRIDSFAK